MIMHGLLKTLFWNRIPSVEGRHVLKGENTTAYYGLSKEKLPSCSFVSVPFFTAATQTSNLKSQTPSINERIKLKFYATILV